MHRRPSRQWRRSKHTGSSAAIPRWRRTFRVRLLTHKSGSARNRTRSEPSTVRVWSNSPGTESTMATVIRSPWTPTEFAAWERNQPERHELVGGQVRMMVGGTAAHAAIVGSVFARLRDAARRRGCRVFATDMKLKAADNVTYPDLFATCAPVDDRATIIDDAVVVIEVLSPSTHDVDFGRKLLGYQQL
ncbi:MAG: Uma2 family endonuclease, partial [Alphaproteobacteria bacterium]|nr:Uma2 family endonuclease [Alphaproteobacteria bacterium]